MAYKLRWDPGGGPHPIRRVLSVKGGLGVGICVEVGVAVSVGVAAGLCVAVAVAVRDYDSAANVIEARDQFKCLTM